VTLATEFSGSACVSVAEKNESGAEPVLALVEEVMGRNISTAAAG
jgi:hypothetical protein